MTCRASSSRPSKVPDTEHRDTDGAYYIVNAQTGDYAAQLGDVDRSEIVTINDKSNHGSHVNRNILNPAIFVADSMIVDL